MASEILETLSFNGKMLEVLNCKEIQLHLLYAVSYTHLDVYKRQTVHSATMKINYLIVLL